MIGQLAREQGDVSPKSGTAPGNRHPSPFSEQKTIVA
jgi:hypothetical protein